MILLAFSIGINLPPSFQFFGSDPGTASMVSLERRVNTVRSLYFPPVRLQGCQNGGMSNRENARLRNFKGFENQER